MARTGTEPCSRAARHSAEYLAEGLGYVWVKKVGAPPGTTVVLELEGSAPFAFEVREGRGTRTAEVPAEPTVRLRADLDAWIRLAGGRCAPEPGGFSAEGDPALVERLLANLATTP